MIGKILLGLVKFISGLITLILTPIDLAITSYFPELSDALIAVNNVLDFIENGISWAVSISGLSQSCLSLIVTYYTFKLTIPLIISGFKLVVKWWNALV